MKNFLLAAILLISVSAVAQTTQNQPVVGKVGFVDIEYVLSELPETANMEQKLVEMRNKLTQDFATKQQEYKRIFEDYSARYQSMDDSAKNSANAHINQLQSDLQGFEGQAQQTLENTRKLYMAPIYLKIGRAIAEVAVENGYAMLIPSGLGGRDFVVWGDERFDASALLIERMKKAAESPAAEKAAPDKNKKKN